MLPVADCLNDAFVFGYCLLSCVGPSQPVKQSWKKHVVVAQLAHWLVLFIHAIYFIVYPCAPWMVTASQAFYSLSSIVFTLLLHRELFAGERSNLAAAQLNQKRKALKLK